jgi:GMP synthase-like glutamine amidotransferase
MRATLSCVLVKPILVIEQEYSLRGIGLLGERLDASGLPYRRFRAWEEPIDELEARDFAALIPLGGNGHAWDEDARPALRPQRLLLRRAVEEGVPVFGICLGGQLLALALGGEVRTADEPERGWLEIAPTEAARDDPIFGILDAPVGVYQWHHDVFEPPPGARVLATSPGAPNQAYRVDGAEAWGIQFHPEATPELWELWIARHPVEVEESGVDVDALRTAVYEGAAASLAFRTALFDAFIGRASRA